MSLFAAGWYRVMGRLGVAIAAERVVELGKEW
jgi:hypothetical protein